MLTENIDLKLGAPNGTNGIITKLEFDFKNNVCSIFVNPIKICANSLEKINS
jgi:hypothetical protein